MHLMMGIWILKEYDYVQIPFAYLSKILETFYDYDYCRDYCFPYNI